MRILIIATFLVFLTNAFVQADVTAPEFSEKMIFCKSDSEHLGLVNIFKPKNSTVVLAEANEIQQRRVYLLSIQDAGSYLKVRGENELINPSANLDYKESEKKFTAVVSKQSLQDYQKKPFVVTMEYDSGMQIEFYCEAAVKSKK